MEIQIKVVYIILGIFLINSVLEHLFNWWYRILYHNGSIDTIFATAYVLKTLLVLILLLTLIK
jgi:hypothetical protein